MWYLVAGEETLNSPGLLVYPARIKSNINKMIEMVGDLHRLCPHVKTHKMSSVTRLYMEAGVKQFKCATIAEAEMLAGCEAESILLAYQPVGPAVSRLMRLAETFPSSRFATVVDNAGSLEQLSRASSAAQQEITVYLDIDNGMHRTGLRLEQGARELYQQAARATGLAVAGFHVYDGHIRHADVAERERAANAALQPIYDLADTLERDGYQRPRLVVGGTPTFPVHANYADRICSPGTSIFWDHGYAQLCPELQFEPAAVLITRVISQVGRGSFCLDLGYKAVAAESPPPRASFLNVSQVKEVLQSEEHLVVELQGGENLKVGDVLYAVPKHICPTVALHQQVYVVEEGVVTDTWKVDARDRVITI